MRTQLNADIENKKFLPYNDGSERILREESEFFSRAKNRIDICIDHTQPQSVIQNEELKKSIFDAKSRDTKTRCVTEITKNNLSFCKELMQLTGRLRHLEGVKANFMVSEKEYVLAPLGLSYNGKSRQEGELLSSSIVYSDLKEAVEQQRYLFESLWSKADPAEEIIKKIEESAGEYRQDYEIKVIRNSAEIIKELISLNERSNEMLTCTTPGGMQLVYTYLFDVKKKVIDKQKEGKHKGIRYISEINKDNMELAKTFVDFGIQLRHAKTLPSMSFGLTDKEVAATIEKMENGKNTRSLIIGNDPTYLSHFRSIFEELWSNGIRATDRIKDIEEGRETDDELADARRYLKEVLVEVNNMKNNAERQGHYIP